MREIYVGKIGDYEEFGRKLFTFRRIEFGVFRVHGEFHAYRNYCQHQGGPVCQGKIIPRVLEVLDTDQTSLGQVFSKDEIHIVCPWHGYEFDIKTGLHPGDSTVRLRKFPVDIRGEDVYVTV